MEMHCLDDILVVKIKHFGTATQQWLLIYICEHTIITNNITCHQVDFNVQQPFSGISMYFILLDFIRRGDLWKVIVRN